MRNLKSSREKKSKMVEQVKIPQSTENLGKTSFYVDNYQNLFGDGG